MNIDEQVLAEIHEFLHVPTPKSWLEWSQAHPDILLIDHAHCEKKAASSALNLMYRYVENFPLLNKMSRLAREELRHFEQVLAIMQKRGVQYCHLSPARYAGGLREHLRTADPQRLVDLLIVGAIIEARSCERFAALSSWVDDELADFYLSLLKSEGRHYQDYIGLARTVEEYGVGASGSAQSGAISVETMQQVCARTEFFLSIENALISTPDSEFRFHSGVPT